MDKQSNQELQERIEKLEDRLVEMKANSDRLEQILSSLDTGLSLIGPGKKIIWVNRKIREMFPNEEPIGKICYRFYESSQEPCESCPTSRCFLTGKPHRLERYNAAKKRWYGIISQPVKDSSGKVVNVLEGVTNITERKEAEKALQASEGKYRELVQNARDVIYTLDTAGNFLEINEAFLREGGWRQKDVIGESFRKMLHPDDVDTAMDAFQSGLEGHVAAFEMRAGKKDGSYNWYSFVNRPLKDKNQKVVGITGIARNIDDRKRAEKKLKESETKYRMLFELAPISLWEEDFSEVKKRIDELMRGGVEDLPSYLENHPDEVRHLTSLVKIIDVNRATLSLYKARSKQELFEGLDRIFLDESYEDFSRTLMGIHRGKTKFYFEKVHRTLEGERIEVKLNWLVAPGHETDYSKVLVSIVDISDIRQYEAKLRQKQKMEALGTLAGGVAHEINNILAVIIGNAELASEDISGYDPVGHYLEEIRSASLKAKDVIRNILTVARKNMVARKPVRIAEILEEALPLICESLPSFVEVRKVIRCDRERVLADPSEIREVMMNLCSNSAHAMDKGPGVLTIILESVEVKEFEPVPPEKVDPGKYVKLVVMDTGRGISSDIMDRIFDPYFTTKEVNEGIGMGLAVVDGIVKKNKGTIHVESRRNKGTSVTILFPLFDKAEQ